MISGELPKEKQKKRYGCCTPKVPDVFRRLAFWKNEGVDPDQLFMDSIELQTLMPKLTEQDMTVDIVERYVLFSLAVLYAGMCPLALVVVFVFFFTDIFAEFFTLTNCIERAPAWNNANSAIWNYFVQAIVVCAVLTNLYVFNAFSNVYELTLETVFGHEGPSLWVIVLTEHILVLVVFLAQFVIPDIPAKVRKMRER